MNFVFPAEEIGSFASLDQIKSFLNQQLSIENLSAYCSYRFRATRNKYIYCVCRDCLARLVFRKEGERYVLIQANTHH